MNIELIGRHFARMGSRFKITRPTSRWQRKDIYTINIKRDIRGDFFDLSVPVHMDEKVDIIVMQAVPEDRHLLLLVRQNDSKIKDRYLCGHDERAWFVAAVPGGASSVLSAKEALKPEEVRQQQAVCQLSARHANQRKNRAFRRQGEWFFIEQPDIQVDPKSILKNEAIRRSGGKPHIVAEVYRTGGEQVFVHKDHPNGVTEAEYARIKKSPSFNASHWRVFMRNPGVYARGTIRHLDHRTITLQSWHRVIMNTEHKAEARRNLTFLD